jgi:hypothetical protein
VLLCTNQRLGEGGGGEKWSIGVDRCRERGKAKRGFGKPLVRGLERVLKRATERDRETRLSH